MHKLTYKDTTLHYPNIEELVENRKFAIDQSLQLINATSLIGAQAKGIASEIKRIQDLPIAHLKIELEKISIILDVAGSLTVSLDYMIEACTYFYYLEDEPHRPTQEHLNKKKEIFAAGGVRDFFILNWLTAWLGSIELSQHYLERAKRELQAIPQGLINLFNSKQIELTT